MSDRPARPSAARQATSSDERQQDGERARHGLTSPALALRLTLPSLVSSRKSTACGALLGEDRLPPAGRSASGSSRTSRRRLARLPCAPPGSGRRARAPRRRRRAGSCTRNSLRRLGVRRERRGSASAVGRRGRRPRALMPCTPERAPSSQGAQPLLPQLVEGCCSARSGSGSGSARRCCGSRRWRSRRISASTWVLSSVGGFLSTPPKNFSHSIWSCRRSTARCGRGPPGSAPLRPRRRRRSRKRQPQLARVGHAACRRPAPRCRAAARRSRTGRAACRAVRAVEGGVVTARPSASVLSRYTGERARQLERARVARARRSASKRRPTRNGRGRRPG